MDSVADTGPSPGTSRPSLWKERPGNVEHVGRGQRAERGRRHRPRLWKVTPPASWAAEGQRRVNHDTQERAERPFATLALGSGRPAGASAGEAADAVGWRTVGGAPLTLNVYRVLGTGLREISASPPNSGRMSAAVSVWPANDSPQAAPWFDGQLSRSPLRRASLGWRSEQRTKELRTSRPHVTRRDSGQWEDLGFVPMRQHCVYSWGRRGGRGRKTHEPCKEL